jgi:uncharacterized protein (DUF362 family)
MKQNFSRRGFIGTTAGALTALGLNKMAFMADSAAAAPATKSTVSIVRGESRRKNITEALQAIQEQILPKLKTRKCVIIKPNIVNTVNQLASTHVDALQGVLDFLAPVYKGPVIIAESSAGFTTMGYDHFNYNQAIKDHPGQNVTLLDLNEEGRHETTLIMDADLHPAPVRLAARLVDPEAFVICCGVMKTHNTVLATLSIKNMALGAPLHSARKDSPRWNDKRVYHGGVRQTHYDIMLTAQKLAPAWGAAVIDGFEGMEGNGPNSGTPVPSRIAIASTDFVAADRVGIETMGIDPGWIAYLNYCAKAGLGEYDLSKIDIRGAKITEVARKYQLHPDLDRQLQWRGPMNELPPRLGLLHIPDRAEAQIYG